MIVICVALATAVVVAPGYLRAMRADDIIPGPGVTAEKALSDYLPALAGSPGETAVYLLEGAQPGGTVLVLGGTHADESAGYLSAVLLVERAEVSRGRLIVIPRANASGFTHTIPLEGHPSRLHFPQPDGGYRSFSLGARATNPIHQWPDPQVYVLPGSGQVLSGIETRNLNRAYPGRPDGTLTERIAYAITSLIREEKVDLAIDLHEAAPEYPVVSTIVAHERALDLAALVSMNMHEAGTPIGLEPSPRKLHGLSHREWGDATETLAVLMETANPSQGRLRGRTDEALVIQGRDRFYRLAARRGRLSVPYPDDGWPIELRIGRHLAGIDRFARDLGDLAPERGVELRSIPSPEQLLQSGLGACLN